VTGGVTANERRVVLAAWLRWTSLARVVEAANLAGATDPIERYRFVAERAHGMSGERLDDYLRFAEARLADGTWRPIPDRLAPEAVVGERGAALLRAHGLGPAWIGAEPPAELDATGSCPAPPSR
jgi:hypothetical protein